MGEKEVVEKMKSHIAVESGHPLEGVSAERLDNGDTVLVIKPEKEEAIAAFIKMFGGWGTNKLTLTEEAVNALLDRKVIVWGQGEYSVVLDYDGCDFRDDYEDW